MLNFFIGFAFFEAGAFFGFFVAALLNAAHAGQMYDAVAGTFLVVGLGEEDFASLTPEMAQKYERLFHQPEDFIRLGHRIVVVRVPDEAVCPEESKTTPPKDAGFDR